MMVIPKEGRERVVMLASLVIIQMGLIIGFCVHRHSIESFIVVSGILTVLFATLYWIGWLVRHGVTNFEVCMLIGGGVIALNFWHDGNRILSAAFAGASLVFAMILLQRLLRPIDIDQQEDNLRRYRAEADKQSPAKEYATSLIAYAILGGIIWVVNGFAFPRDAKFLLFLGAFATLRIIYRALIDRKPKNTIGPSNDDATVQGGRA